MNEAWQTQPGGRSAVGAALDEVEASIMALAPPGPLAGQVVADARARAEVLVESAAVTAGGPWFAVATFLADALTGLWLERRWSEEDVTRLLRSAASAAGVSEAGARLGIFQRVLRERHVLGLPPVLGMEAVLGLLARIGPAPEASLWALDGAGRLTMRVGVGVEGPTRRVRTIARQALDAGLVTGSRSLLHGIAITRWNEQNAALVVRTRPETRARALAYAREAAVALGPLLETHVLLERNAAREQSLVGASERRLVRIGADLHDGPLQELAALAGDLRLFRSQLGEVVAAETRERVLGRVDDLEARLVALDRELRELSGSLASPGIMAVPFPELLRGEVESFSRTTGVRVDLSLEGGFDTLTASQRIALVRAVREALQNVHEHSGARRASVRMTEDRARLRARVEDDGAGFDVERRLVQAARAGRLGLVGMGERIRLLGGRLEIESRPGGPTVVTAAIPRWQPQERRPARGAG